MTEKVAQRMIVCRRRRRLPAVACAALLAMSCAGGEGPVAGTEHVRAVVLPFLTMMPFHIAAEEGFFAAQGLDVEFVRLPRNQDIMASLARGDVDVAGGMITVNELALAARGERVRMVADLGRLSPDSCTLTAFLARREHVESGALQDPARIREMVFDADVLIPFGYWIDELLAPVGLTVDDIEIVNVPPPAAVEALANGSIDVTVDSEPLLTFHAARGAAEVWAPVEDLVPGYSLSVLMYGASLLDGRPEVGERFAVAMLEAIRVFGQGKTPRNLAIVERASGLTAEQVASACWPSVPADARLDAASFRGYQEWNVARGLVDRILAEDELFDHRFIDAANAALAR